MQRFHDYTATQPGNKRLKLYCTCNYTLKRVIAQKLMSQCHACIFLHFLPDRKSEFKATTSKSSRADNAKHKFTELLVNSNQSG